MRQFISSVFKKSALVTVAAVSVMSLAWASVVTVTQPGTAAATISCTPNLGTDQDTNIIFNGLAGTTADAMRTSLQTAFTNNDSGNHCNDIQALLGGLGLTNTMLANSTGWTTGWTKHDGTVSTDAGTVVGTGAQIYSRCWIENTSTGQSNCNPLSMYQLVLNEKNGNYLGVYQHAATFFTNRSQTPERTLIHINSDG